MCLWNEKLASSQQSSGQQGLIYKSFLREGLQNPTMLPKNSEATDDCGNIYSQNQREGEMISLDIKELSGGLLAQLEFLKGGSQTPALESLGTFMETPDSYTRDPTWRSYTRPSEL